MLHTRQALSPPGGDWNMIGLTLTHHNTTPTWLARCSLRLGDAFLNVWCNQFSITFATFSVDANIVYSPDIHIGFNKAHRGALLVLLLPIIKQHWHQSSPFPDVIMRFLNRWWIISNTTCVGVRSQRVILPAVSNMSEHQCFLPHNQLWAPGILDTLIFLVDYQVCL